MILALQKFIRRLRFHHGDQKSLILFSEMDQSSGVSGADANLLEERATKEGAGHGFQC